MLFIRRTKPPRARRIAARDVAVRGLAVSGLALLLAFAMGGCGKPSLTPQRAFNKNDCAIRCATLGLTPVAEAQPIPRSPIPPIPPSGPERASTAAELQHGSGLFRSYGCVLCHGAAGRGDGRIAATLRNRPRDLRDLAAFEQGTSVAAISATIERGIVPSGMPAHAFIPPPERELLARYILSLSDTRHLTRGDTK